MVTKTTTHSPKCRLCSHNQALNNQPGLHSQDYNLLEAKTIQKPNTRERLHILTILEANRNCFCVQINTLSTNNRTQAGVHVVAMVPRTWQGSSDVHFFPQDEEILQLPGPCACRQSYPTGRQQQWLRYGPI